MQSIDAVRPSTRIMIVQCVPTSLPAQNVSTNNHIPCATRTIFEGFPSNQHQSYRLHELGGCSGHERVGPFSGKPPIRSWPLHHIIDEASASGAPGTHPRLYSPIRHHMVSRHGPRATSGIAYTRTGIWTWTLEGGAGSCVLPSVDPYTVFALDVSRMVHCTSPRGLSRVKPDEVALRMELQPCNSCTPWSLSLPTKL